MLIWYAYRMDVISFGASKTIMAPYCIGSAPDRSCLFDEFLRYIQRVGKGTHLWTGSTSVGNNLKPDVLGTAQELDNGGTQGTPSRYSNTLAPSDIFPNLYFKGQSPDFSNLFGKVVDNIQECRQEMERKGRIDDIADELNSARHATKLFHSARIANQAEHVIEDVNKWLDETHQIQWVSCHVDRLIRPCSFHLVHRSHNTLSESRHTFPRRR